MIKRTFFAAACLLAASTAFSQEATNEDIVIKETVEYSTDKHKVETNGFWSNWFVSAGAGVQMYFGDHDREAKFGNRISPALDIAVGKWFSPEIGVRLMYNGLSAKGATRWGQAHSTGDQVDGWGIGMYKSKFKYFNFQVDAMFNLSNIICGYNENRVYNCSPYIGVGVMKVTDDPKDASISGHFGIMNSFRISSAIDINLDLRGTLTSDELDGEIGGRWGEGLFAATVGITYKINPRGWNRAKTVTRNVYDNTELNAMREKLNRLNEENARLADELARKSQEKPVVKQIASANVLIVFPIGKSTLSNQARVSLGMLADAINAGDESTVYTITGYADAGTGSKELNERLSKERAEAVRDCLVDEFGVDASQLKVDYKGGVENMFYDDPRMSRAVITSSK